MAQDPGFPIIIRPRGSHAGGGLARLTDPTRSIDYLKAQPEREFFVSRFVDYANADGLFRKYRIVVIDGRAYAGPHGDRRSMGHLVPQRRHVVQRKQAAEEAEFMRSFDTASRFATKPRCRA